MITFVVTLSLPIDFYLKLNLESETRQKSACSAGKAQYSEYMKIFSLQAQPPTAMRKLCNHRKQYSPCTLQRRLGQPFHQHFLQLAG